MYNFILRASIGLLITSSYSLAMDIKIDNFDSKNSSHYYSAQQETEWSVYKGGKGKLKSRANKKSTNTSIVQTPPVVAQHTYKDLLSDDLKSKLSKLNKEKVFDMLKFSTTGSMTQGIINANCFLREYVEQNKGVSAFQIYDHILSTQAFNNMEINRLKEHKVINFIVNCANGFRHLSWISTTNLKNNNKYRFYEDHKLAYNNGYNRNYDKSERLIFDMRLLQVSELLLETASHLLKTSSVDQEEMDWLVSNISTNLAATKKHMGKK